MSSHLTVQRTFDRGTPLDFRLATLYLAHYTIDVLQLVAALPEHRTVLHHLVRRFAFHLTRNVLDIIAAILFVCLDELIKVSLRPVGEALRQQRFLLHQLLFRQRFGFVNFALLLPLHLVRLRAEVRVFRHLVVHRLAIVVNLLIEQLEQPRREELKVLHDRLLRWAGRFRCFRFGHAQRLLEVRIDRIVRLALALRRLDPRAERLQRDRNVRSQKIRSRCTRR